MQSTEQLQQHFEQHLQAVRDSAEVLSEPLERAGMLLTQTIAENHKVLACGNGGSASDAQHFIAELVGRFERERFALPGIALTTDTSILTAVSNDYGYDDVFARQVSALGQEGDLLVAISTSGNSTNVIRAIQVAQDRGMPVIALSGKGGGDFNQILQPEDIHLCVPHDRTMRIQEIHIMLLHMLCDSLDHALLGPA